MAVVLSRLKVFWFSKDNLTHKEKGKEEVARRRDGKTILKSRQEWTLPAQLGQLKQDKVERDCCEVICEAPQPSKVMGIKREKNRQSEV